MFALWARGRYLSEKQIVQLSDNPAICIGVSVSVVIRVWSASPLTALPLHSHRSLTPSPTRLTHLSDREHSRWNRPAPPFALRARSPEDRSEELTTAPPSPVSLSTPAPHEHQRRRHATPAAAGRAPRYPRRHAAAAADVTLPLLTLSFPLPSRPSEAAVGRAVFVAAAARQSRASPTSRQPICANTERPSADCGRAAALVSLACGRVHLSRRGKEDAQVRSLGRQSPEGAEGLCSAAGARLVLAVRARATVHGVPLAPWILASIHSRVCICASDCSDRLLPVMPGFTNLLLSTVHSKIKHGLRHGKRKLGRR